MESPIAVSPLGSFIGHFVSTYGGRKVAAFNGIPYAKPPTNTLRFKEPVKIEAHEGLYDATEDGNDCIQANVSHTKYLPEDSAGKKYVGSENCLFLNVYTPNLRPEKRYPVIVYIHGGGYVAGTGSINWYGPHMLLDKDVILVAMNYRLGVFGFLTLDDAVFPANLGLKDQSMAIHWVKDNIASFGGDAENITVMGQSAGATSAHFQLLSSHNKGLIKRGICQSGTWDCPWALVSRKAAKETAIRLASILDCSTKPQEMLRQLQGKTAEQILDAVKILEKECNLVENIFGPVLENQRGGFINDEDLRMESDLPIMTGVTKDEGFLYYRNLCRAGDSNLKSFNENHKKIFPLAFSYQYNPEKNEITEKIKHHYFGDNSISEESYKKLITMITDGRFFYGLKFTKEHKGKSYIYLIAHEGQKSLINELSLTGVCHADELFYLFPFSKVPKKIEFNEADSKVQKLLVELWTKFATYGDPTPGQTQPKWNESQHGEICSIITSNGLEQSEDHFKSVMHFWDSLAVNQDRYVHPEDDI